VKTIPDMTIRDLIKELIEYPLDMQVVISDHTGDGRYSTTILVDPEPANVLIVGSITTANNRTDDILVLH